MDQKRIPVCEPTLGPRELEYVTRAVSTGWISSAGEFIPRFEETFSEKVGAREGIAVCNGTVGLHLGLKALGIGGGDEVILPSFTMVASALAIQYCGATPVFIDSDPDTWTMDPAQLKAALTPRTKAVMSVTIYGHPCDLDPIASFCRQHGLSWLEDAAEGHGALYQGKKLAALPDVTVYSFYANKIISTGEGGMVCTNRRELADRCRSLKNLAFPLKGERRYHHEEVGFNYRMTNLQAALGCAQTERFESLVEMRRQNARRYSDRLRTLEDLIQLPVEREWARNCYWMYGIVLRPSYTKRTVSDAMALLKERGIESRPFFSPMHTQPIFQTGQSLPIAEHLGAKGLYLPSSSHLTESEIDRIAATLRRVLTP
ncbi:MAG: DegT/DnrJ/EryC1/StrS family aminotransferase [Deltaproteobacteria bacterium]|nr:DegT/DnrJ/EryC1/StrS family aminotransferase [Deltaproteobacteria bacterium]